MELAASFIGGAWTEGESDRRLPVLNPATEEPIGEVELADGPMLDRALQAAQRGFGRWRQTSPYDRSAVLARAAALMRERSEAIGALLTLEQGKPLREAIGEVLTAADNLQWMGEEATHAYGRLLPERAQEVRQIVRKEPVGPVAAFCPWNFPALTPARKIGGALAAGCSLILKPSEETPYTSREIVRCFIDVGLPPGVLNLVYGEPETVSRHLIASPIIGKISFTGSTAVGKQLLALAATGVKRATMELGGHAPVIVCDDVNPVAAATQCVPAKFRNAGQVCTSPTRFFVQRRIHAEFLDAFTRAASELRVGDGREEGVQMGPLANVRRVAAMERFVADAVGRGATIRCGGRKRDGRGFFFPPTVLEDVPADAAVLRDEPFGPIVPIIPFDTIEEAIVRSNATPYGLAAYVLTASLARASMLSEALQAGMVAINHFTVSTPASPFGGVKESGYGSEGGMEGLEAYLVTKTVTLSAFGLPR